MNSIARPASSAARITSSSRIEPPGWITAVAPASTAASSPSAKGKNASLATAEPTVRGWSQPKVSAASRALAAAIRAGVDAILAANAEDVAEAKAAGGSAAFLDRLTLDGGRLAAMAAGQAEHAPVLALLAALVLWLHRANIARLRAGTEPKLGGARRP